ncbi:E3 ubiquitin-protein ligase TRIM56-like [Mizuhopecten yessoensis]|uniref:E3 ubiquitin-protein ligase TRIM56 n=1 Tax=Mizuhopecten yessoensis TaxID=6573 RepID=A0A210Q4R8_MIZYE|nr:E3 ubiquitin-protein ligase TRIM56-like [Mizuhopecten yessoensis]XP_021367167.1 E3 ubiquitin-protein ligase TRIM56-like [Mizuhopecten yessoensis]OWF43740.1 E3 ubiquitin-protein ligase TRIM56 [Mizuhopecten yessoensis]
MECDKSVEGDKIERLRERILQCPICMDEFQDPRILPCHHSVCLNCLLDYVRHSSSSGRLFRCPQCRSDVCVPRGGVKDFPPNFYINCIQDEIGARPYFGVCDVCRRDWLVSQYRCINCDLDICKFCIHDHRLFSHANQEEANIMRIETGNIGTMLSSQRTCSTHEGEALHMFCATCDILVCMTCLCEDHKQHSTQPLGRKLRSAQHELQTELDTVGVELVQVDKVMGEVTDLRTSILQEREACVRAVRAQARALTLEIDAQGEEFISNITADGSVPALENYSSQLSNYRDQLQRGIHFLENLEEGDISLELIDTYQRYQKSVSECQKGLAGKTFTHQQPSFSPGQLRKAGQYRLFHFGGLKNIRNKIAFLPLPPRKGRWGGMFDIIRGEQARVAFTGCWRALVAMMTLVMVVTLIDLSLKLCTSPGTFTQTLAGFTFVLYVSVAAVCAYIKA